MTEITDVMLKQMSSNYRELYPIVEEGIHIRIADLAAALLQAREQNAALTKWHDDLLAGDGQSVEMAFVNFRNWAPERQRQLGMMLLPDYAALQKQLAEAEEDAGRLYDHMGYNEDCNDGFGLARKLHEARVQPQEAQHE